MKEAGNYWLGLEIFEIIILYGPNSFKVRYILQRISINFKGIRKILGYTKLYNCLYKSLWSWIHLSKHTNLAPHLPPVFSMIFDNRLAGDITTGLGVVVVVVLLVVLLVLRARGTSNSCFGFGVVKYGGFDRLVYKYCWR